MAINVKKYVDSLVKAGFDKKDAETKVKAVVDAAKKNMPNESDDVQDKTIGMAIRRLVAASKGEKFSDLVLVALGDLGDTNAPTKKKAIEAFEKDAMAAVRNKLVEVKDGKPIPLDTRKYLDKEEKMENKNYGKPLGESIRREAIFIRNGEFTRAFGNFEAEVGSVYDAFGKSKEGREYITINKVPQPILKGTLSPKDLWTQSLAAAEASSMGIALADVVGGEKNKNVVVLGNVRATGTTQKGKAMVVLEDEDTPDGVVMFAGSSSAHDRMSTVETGHEVLAFGRIGILVSDDGEERYNISCTGIVSNPESAKIAAAVKDLDSVIFG